MSGLLQRPEVDGLQGYNAAASPTDSSQCWITSLLCPALDSGTFVWETDDGAAGWLADVYPRSLFRPNCTTSIHTPLRYYQKLLHNIFRLAPVDHIVQRWQWQQCFNFGGNLRIHGSFPVPVPGPSLGLLEDAGG